MKLYDDKWIVVTGGAGFIGSGVIKQLNKRGMTKNVVVVDVLGSDERWKNLVGKQFSEFIHRDQFFDWLKAHEGEVEAIIHLGACSDTMERDADFLIENNYRYSVELAEYALRNEVRFIYASSAAVYGDGSQGFSDDHDLFEELRPLNMYGYSKLLFDLWVKQQGVLDKLVGLRYFNVFGPNEQHKGRMASAILKMVPDIMTKGKISLFKSNDRERFGDGEQSRDFIYVKDCARITCDFLENDHSGVYNVGTGKASTWNELAKAVIIATKKPAGRIEYIDMPEALRGKYQNYTCADMRKFRKTLGEENAFTMPLEQSVGDYVSSHLLQGASW